MEKRRRWSNRDAVINFLRAYEARTSYKGLSYFAALDALKWFPSPKK